MWQEQVSPDELALLQSRAKTIARSAGRRKLREIALSLVALGMSGAFLFFHPTSLWIKLGFAPLLAGAIWFWWWRQRLTRAALAIAVDHPRAFFATAIENLRGELRFSMAALVTGWPAFFGTIWLAKASDGVDFGQWLRRLPHDVTPVGAALLAFMVLVYLFFVRERFKLWAQLRRLEAMQREWEEQGSGDGRVSN